GVVYRTGGQAVIAPATPLLELLLATPIAPLPADAKDAWAWVGFLADADRAHSRGDHVAALFSLREAIAVTPKDAAACDTIGAQHMLAWLIGSAANDADRDDLDAVRESC